MSNPDPGAKRPKGSPMMIVLLVIVVGPTLLIGQFFGAGAATIIGGFIALFTLISSMGGPLRASLLRFSFVGPLVAFGAVAPRLLATYSIPAAIALATAVVFIAGLLPLRSARYTSTALGLGMGTLLGYSMPIGPTSGLRLLAAALAGLVVAVLLLLLLGLRDPSGPTRKAIADLLEDENRDFATAFTTWTSDRAPRWLGAVLMAVGKYRLARRVVSAEPPSESHTAALDAAASRASAIAEVIRARKPASEPDNATTEPLAQGSPASNAMFAALDELEQAACVRDTTPTPLPAGTRRRIDAESVRAALGGGSIQLRHALRTTLAVLIALLVSLALEPDDPLLPTLLLTTFGIVQVSWHATLTRALDRFGGIIVGGILVVLILVFLPHSFLFPISMVALAIGMWFITARPAIGTAGLIVMSVGLNSELRNLDPYAVVIEYAALTLAALVIGTVIGFVIVPSWRPPKIPVRVNRSFETVAAALTAFASEGQPEARRDALAQAQASIQQLVPDHEKLTGPQQQELESLREDLQDLLVTSIFLTMSGEPPKPTALTTAAAILATTPGSEAHEASGDASALSALAIQVVDQRQRLEAALAGAGPA